jgi:serine/threonine-protein kinase
MPEPGARLGGRYRLDERVGAGGMGEVWRATDELLGRPVAVKVMLPALLREPGFARRFLVEAQAMASVDHPRVVAIHDYHSDQGQAFLVMAYVDGEPLSRLTSRLGRLSPAYTMAMVAQAADALRAVHDRGIVHRDIKPGNLLVRADGAVMLTDFGIARAEANPTMTTTGAVLGTPSYLAPEQVLGQRATPLSDIYSLGLVAYECLAGRQPFEGESPIAVALQRIREMPRTLGIDVPPAVLAVVEHALATDPAHRWQSAAELAEAARRAAAGLSPLRDRRPPPASPASPAPPASTHRSRSRPLRAAVVAVALGVVLLGVGAWISLNLDRDDRDGGNPTSFRTSEATASAGPDSALAGFVACDELFCPPEPVCWGGLFAIGGVAQPIRSIDCGDPHVWETFAVALLPEDAVDTHQDELMDHPDIADACSETVMAARSGDPSATDGWDRDAWPIQAEDGTWLLHCLATPPDLPDSTGAAFHSS